MAIQLDTYKRQVEVSSDTGQKMGSLELAGKPGQALSRVAESVGKDVTKLFTTVEDLKSKSRLSKLQIDLLDLSNEAQSESNDAILRRGKYAPQETSISPVELPQGQAESGQFDTRGKPLITTEQIKEEILNPYIEKIKKLKSDGGFLRNESSQVDLMINKVINTIEVNAENEQFKRDVAEQQFNIGNSIYRDQELLSELNKKYLNISEDQIPEADKFRIDQLNANVDSNMSILEQTMAPGEPQKQISKNLYLIGKSEILATSTSAIDGNITFPEAIKEIENTKKRFLKNKRLIGTHRTSLAEVDAQTNINSLKSRASREAEKLTTGILEKIDLGSALPKDIEQIISQLELYGATGAVELIKASIETDLSFAATPGRTEKDDITIAVEALNNITNGTGDAKDFLEAYKNVKASQTRQLLAWSFGNVLENLGSEGYDLIYNGKTISTNNPQMQDLLNTLAYYSQNFFLEGSYQREDTFNNFFNNAIQSYKKFLNPQSTDTPQTFDDWKKNTFKSQALNIVQTNNGLGYEDYFGSSMDDDINFNEVDKIPDNAKKISEDTYVAENKDGSITEYITLDNDTIISLDELNVLFGGQESGMTGSSLKDAFGINETEVSDNDLEQSLIDAGNPNNPADPLGIN
jgi:rRNA maturation endonuclease Nob1